MLVSSLTREWRWGWLGCQVGWCSGQLLPLLISQPWRGAREPVEVFASVSGICRCLCFKRAWKPPLAEGVGETCYKASWLSEKREQKSWQEVSRGGEGSVCNSLLRYIKIPAMFHPGWEGSRRVPPRACLKRPSHELG